MAHSEPKIQKARQDLETELLEIMRERQREWASAKDEHRDLMRQRFMNALHAFNSLVLYDKHPPPFGEP
jgi:hypothetical protein